MEHDIYTYIQKLSPEHTNKYIILVLLFVHNYLASFRDRDILGVYCVECEVLR